MSRDNVLAKIDLPGGPLGEEWLEIILDPENAYEESRCAVIIVHHMSTALESQDGPLYFGEHKFRAEAEVNMPVQTAIRLRNALDAAIVAAERVTVQG